jgi:hypothetical protein
VAVWQGLHLKLDDMDVCHKHSHQCFMVASYTSHYEFKNPKYSSHQAHDHWGPCLLQACKPELLECSQISRGFESSLVFSITAPSSTCKEGFIPLYRSRILDSLTNWRHSALAFIYRLGLQCEKLTTEVWQTCLMNSLILKCTLKVRIMQQKWGSA